MKITNYDLRMCVARLPQELKSLMIDKSWENKIYVAGGFIRACIANEKINDIDVFVQSKEDANLLAGLLAKRPSDIHSTDNAITIKSYKPVIQIVHRWVFNKIEDVASSFDFTICASAISYSDGKFESYCSESFYQDLAAKRLVYTLPQRNEDAGGSMLRVLKYYQRGYRIPLDSLGYVMARMVAEIDTNRINTKDEKAVGFVLSGMLRLVDPATDPTHEAHLPSLETEEN